MSAATAASNSSNARQGVADAKVLKDLDTVKEKMDLCEAMLNPGAGNPAPSVRSSEAMLAIIGFLEACAPRMVQLVEVAAQGALSEDVLIKCLEYNDRLHKILEEVDTKALTETAASTTAATVNNATSQFDDLLLNTEEGADNVTPPVGGKSTGEEDEDVFAVKPQAMPQPDTAPAAADLPTKAEEDDFDDFFQQRVGGGATSGP